MTGRQCGDGSSGFFMPTAVEKPALGDYFTVTPYGRITRSRQGVGESPNAAACRPSPTAQRRFFFLGSTIFKCRTGYWRNGGRRRIWEFA